MASYDKSRGKFIARVMVSGKSYKKLFDDEDQAVAWEQTKRTELENYDPSSHKELVGSFFEKSVPYLWPDSPNMLNLVRQSKALAKFIGLDTPLADVTNLHAVKFRTSLLDAGRAGSTINNYAATFNRIMAHAVTCGHIQSPSPSMAYQKQRKGRVVFLEPQQEQGLIKFFHHVGREDYADLLITLIYTGARISELLKLRWVDVKDKTVTFWDTKTSTPRTVPLSTAAQQALRRRRTVSPAQPFPIPYQTYAAAFDRAKAACNLPDITIHTCRHTCASRLVQGGVDIRRVKDWMGHTTIQTTMIYAHLAPTDLFVGADVLDQVSPTVSDGSTNVVPMGQNGGTN
jgi:integrase